MTPYINSTSYLQLPDDFYEAIAPTPINNPYWVKFNHELASTLSDKKSAPFNEKEALAIYSGNQIPSHLKSIALAYSGHQFGYYAPLLGDGRAILLGEIISKGKQRWDVQLKGSGRTRFSRTGDGRAPLSAVLREYLISEAMHGLQIPTTRCLAVVASKEQIYRQTGPVPLGVLTRIAAGSLRIGSFEYAASRQNQHLLRNLADYALTRHYPELLTQSHPYLELFQAIVERQAYLIAEWMGVGFIHGVMNTDNMAISGETLDYGPCAFMDEFDLNTVFSSIDLEGRYAYGNQASIAQWNLAVLCQCLQPLFEDAQAAQKILDSFATRFYYYWDKKIRNKLGLLEENQQTAPIITDFFALLQKKQPDFTNTFRMLSQAVDSEETQKNLIDVLEEQWVSSWLNCIRQQNIEPSRIKAQMEQVNPAYIPRNHLVEKAINQFIESHDSTLMDSLLSVLKNPYQQQEGTEHLQQLPSAEERVSQTFCGT